MQNPKNTSPCPLLMAVTVPKAVEKTIFSMATKWYKILLQKPLAQRMLGHLASLYIRLLNNTNRWHVDRPDSTRTLVANRKPFILCFWHNRIPIMPRLWHGLPLKLQMLISAHRDGRVISHAVQPFGIETVTGSRNKSGARAFREMLRLLKDGHCVGITPDGPRGPRMRATPGAVLLAQLSGVPLVPVSASVSRRRLLQTWDRFIVPGLGGRGVILWGEPLHVRENDDLQQVQLELERRLNVLSDTADRQMGQTPIPPAEKSTP